MDSHFSSLGKQKKEKGKKGKANSAVSATTGKEIPSTNPNLVVNSTSDNTNANKLNLESHPKSEKLVELLTEYFLEAGDKLSSSKTIVFT